MTKIEEMRKRLAEVKAANEELMLKLDAGKEEDNKLNVLFQEYLADKKAKEEAAQAAENKELEEIEAILAIELAERELGLKEVAAATEQREQIMTALGIMPKKEKPVMKTGQPADAKEVKKLAGKILPVAVKGDEVPEQFREKSFEEKLSEAKKNGWTCGEEGCKRFRLKEKNQYCNVHFRFYRELEMKYLPENLKCQNPSGFEGCQGKRHFDKKWIDRETGENTGKLYDTCVACFKHGKESGEKGPTKPKTAGINPTNVPENTAPKGPRGSKTKGYTNSKKATKQARKAANRKG